jgi:hypothetical protein
MTPRPSIARTREVETALAAERAARELAERMVDRAFAVIERMAPKAATPGALPYVPMADAAPKEAEEEAFTTLTPRVWALCEELAFNSKRQEAVNRRMARKFAAQGMSEGQIMNALRKGEQGET